MKNSEAMNINFQFIEVFKNPNKLPITQIHLEKQLKVFKKNVPKNINIEDLSDAELENVYFEKKIEVIPALDGKWLPKTHFYKYQPYALSCDLETNTSVEKNNVLFLQCLEFLLECNYHQFWCTILFEPSAPISLRSFLLNTMSPFQIEYLSDKYRQIYETIYKKFQLVYERLLLFKESELEYMPESFGVSKLVDKKLLNLPIVITLGLLYKDVDLEFLNRVSRLYFENPVHLNFIVKEVETTVDQNFIILEMLHGYLSGEGSEFTVPVSIDKRPSVFNLSWVYSFVNYILNTVTTLNVLFQIYKPAIEICLNNDYPFRLPYIYVNMYKELYELLEEREERTQEAELYEKVLKEIKLGRNEFVDLYHVFTAECLDKTLANIGDTVKQQTIAEVYLRLMTTALEEDYFICDYNATYNVTNQNETFQSCCDIDSTRTDFIVSCINKLPRKKKLEDFLKFKLENSFKEHIATHTPTNLTDIVVNDQPGPSGKQKPDDDDIEDKIRGILEMFPHLGDGFALNCLESYDFNSADVINAILENNLPPHLSEIPFDQIRIPPEPEEEKPILAYKGKRPQYNDALNLLNDKKDIKEIKQMLLEGVQYGYDYMYDDEYDDRFDDDVAIKLPDSGLTEEIPVNNPNRTNKGVESYDSSSEDEEKGEPPKNPLNFCEDPAVIRERREARYRAKQGIKTSANSSKSKTDVVGKPKGQGQDKSVLINRQRKGANKSSHANHNRKSGAQFKRSRGMLPS